MNNNVKKGIYIVGIIVLIVVVNLMLNDDSPNNNIEATQTLQDKVLERGIIRAGYVVYPPGSIKDPNTGELSGIFIDAVEEAAMGLGLEVDWVEEVGWGTMIEGLVTNRYDIIGSPVWPTSSRAREADFTIPLTYSAVGVYVRSDDNRFNNNLNAINSPNVKIATIDGEMSSILADTKFPQADTFSLPQLSSVAEMLLNVRQRKADVAFIEAYFGDQFLLNNPGTVKNIATDKPIRIVGNTLVVKKGELDLVSMLNTALTELLNNGRIDELVEEYKVPQSFYPVAQPFEVPLNLQ
jgi:polar amino acid transport system substrate-binding protein